MADNKKITVQFYKSASGNEPVLEWLKSLNRDDRKKIGSSLKTVEYGFPLGMPISRYMGDGLYEVRINLDNRIARVLFCVEDNKMILLHGFIKKSEKTPKQDLELAQDRKKKTTK